MATNFSPCKGSYVLNQFPINVMFGMNGFHVSASGAIQGHHGPLVLWTASSFLHLFIAMTFDPFGHLNKTSITSHESCIMHANFTHGVKYVRKVCGHFNFLYKMA